MARTLDICIRGGGIVGHVLALLLARERLRVGLVVTPVVNAQADVRAYALNQRARALLRIQHLINLVNALRFPRGETRRAAAERPSA